MKIKIKEKKLNNWVKLIKKTIIKKDKKEIWYNFKTNDYISIFLLRNDSKIGIVRQFRPAINKFIWEFPAGLCDKKIKKKLIAKKEIEEETGHKVKKIIKLKSLYNDTGRVDNKVHFFFATCAKKKQFKIEEGIKVKFITKNYLEKMIKTENFNYNLHASLYMLVKLKNLI